ncbi:MAG: hypothetical protein WC955_04065 [Elusimicrobiota bacterium]
MMYRYFSSIAFLLLISTQALMCYAEDKVEIATQTVVATAGNDAGVAVVYSKYTELSFKNLGWKYDEYLNCAKMVLDKAQVAYSMINDDDIEKGVIPEKIKVIVTLNWRSMSAKQAEQLKKYTERGGKIFAVYQTSFRNEKDEYAADPRNYLLADIFNADYTSWVGAPPKCTYLKRNVPADHPLWQGLPEYVHFYRYSSMINKTRVVNGDSILGVWYDEDKNNTSYPAETNSGLILGKNCVYLGEDIFEPENGHNPIIQKLTGNIIRFLLSTN